MKTASPHYWPAEWERQHAIWLAWPHNRATWPDRFDAIPEVFLQLASEISQTQPVRVLAAGEVLADPRLQVLATKPNVAIAEIATNDAWIRDYGPTFVKRHDDNEVVGVCWKYNGWGERYPPFDKDAAAGMKICQALKCPRSMSAMHCEGGALEGNGAGTILTTRSCLLNQNRNPGWTEQMVEQELRRQLGAKSVIWVDGGGLQGDDTDGHIDQLARFVNSKTVVACCSSTPDDPNSIGLDRNVEILRNATNAAGERLEVYTIPTPPPRFVASSRVPESYCNFLLTNELVVVPTFRHETTDQAALTLLGSLFPERQVVAFDAYDLSWGLGAVHCATQQQPAA